MYAIPCMVKELQLSGKISKLRARRRERKVWKFPRVTRQFKLFMKIHPWNNLKQNLPNLLTFKMKLLLISIGSLPFQDNLTLTLQPKSSPSMIRILTTSLLSSVLFLSSINYLDLLMAVSKSRLMTKHPRLHRSLKILRRLMSVRNRRRKERKTNQK